MLEIVPATRGHIGAIAPRFRTIDRIEARAFGRTPTQALELGFLAGETFTGIVDGRPEAMFGWIVTSALEGEGTPWMLGTEVIYQHPRAMISIAPHWIDRMFDSIMHASNLVSVENMRAIRLLKRWGFAFSEDTHVINGVTFREFWQERR